MSVTPKGQLAVDSTSVSFTADTNTEVQFDSKIKYLLVKTSANVYLGFDQPANTDDALLESSDGWVDISPCEVTRLYLLGVGSGTLYFIARR